MGASVEKFRSMWNKIFDCPCPVDKIAALVISSNSWDGDTGNFVGLDSAGKYGMPPPDGVCDYRGRRGFYHIVIGFSHRKKVRCRISPSRQKNRAELGLNEGAKFAYQNKSVWFVLRADGKIFKLDGRKLKKQLKHKDEVFEKSPDFDKPRSAEFTAFEVVPISDTPCNHKANQDLND